MIKKALREATYMILLLSKVSVQKRGYVQKEFKAALEYIEEKLEDNIYLIPLKINDCTPPERLSKFQWVEYDDKDCFDLIRPSLNMQRERYIWEEQKLIAAKESFGYEQFEEKLVYGNDRRLYILTQFIQFVDDTNPNLKELNEIIKGKKTEFIVGYRKYFHTISGELIDMTGEYADWNCEATYLPNLVTNSIISINENQFNFTAGAHGNFFIEGHNFNVNHLFKLLLQDLFEDEDHENVLNFFSQQCYHELRKLYNEFIEPSQEEIEQQTPSTLFWEGTLDPKWENFDNFFISKNSLEIVFNPYSVAFYAFGLQIVTFPFEKLLPNLTKPSRVQTLMDKLK